MERLLIIIAVLASLCGSLNADVSFTVDANEFYDVKDNDMVRLKTLTAGSGYDIYINDARRPYLNSIGINTIRMHFYLNAYLSGGEIVYDWNSNKYRIDNIRKNGAVPFCYIINVPSVVSTNPSDPNSSDPLAVEVDQTKYEGMIYAALKYFNVTLGYGLKYFDVGNEPSSPGPNYPTDYLARYQRYLKLYRYTVNAVERYETDYPNAPRIKIGGPADHSFSYNLTPFGPVRCGQFNFYERFIQDCSNQGIRIDFISFHFYGNTAAYGGHSRGTASIPTGCEWYGYPSFKQMAADGWDEEWPNDGSHITMKSLKQLRDTYKPNAEIYISELGVHSYGGTEPALISSTNINAAFIATVMKDMVEYGVIDKAIYTFTTSAGYSWQGGISEYWSYGSGFVTYSDAITKAVYNSYRMIDTMANQRVATTGTDRDVQILASKDADRVTVLVTNHDYFGPDSQTASDKTVNININKLLLKSDVVKIKQNVVLNNGFEDLTGDDVNNWLNNYNPKGWTIDQTRGYEGDKSLKVLNGYYSAGLAQPYTFLPNTTYTYSVMVRGQDVKQNKMAIANDGIGGYYMDIPTGTYDWIKVTKTFTTGSNAGSGSLHVVVDGTADGTYWFDSVECGESIPTDPYVKYERYLVSNDTSNLYYLVENNLNVDGAEELQKIAEGTLERSGTELAFPAFTIPKESVSLIVISKPDELIANPGFEEVDMQGWRNNYYPQGWVIDDTVSCSGQKSLKVLDGNTSAGINRDYQFSPNTTYTYKVMVKGENVVNTMLAIAWVNSQQHYLTIPSGTYGWTEVSGQFTTPANVGGSNLIQIVVVPQSSGTYWFDDIRLEKENIIVDNSFEYINISNSNDYNDYCYATGFEGVYNMEGWRNNYYPQGWVIDDTVSCSGQKSLKVLDGNTSAGINRDYQFSPNTTYTYKVMVKGENVVNTMLAIAWVNSQQHYLTIPSGTYGWTEVSGQFTTPADVGGTGLIQIVVVPQSDGTYWFDELEIDEGYVNGHQFPVEVWDTNNIISDSWQPNSYPISYAIDGSVRYEGKSTLRIDSGYTAPGVLQLFEFSPNTTYNYRVIVKGENITNNLMPVANDSVNSYYLNIPLGTYDWTEVSTSFTTEPTAGQGCIHVSLSPSSSGTYWFSDVRLTKDGLQNKGFEIYHGLSAGNVALSIGPDPGPGPVPDPLPPIPPPAGIHITSPGNGTTIYENPVITVSGTVDDNAATVTVNGETATVSAYTFTASGINISPDNQPTTTDITAVAVYPDNSTETDIVSVKYDPNPAPPTPQPGTQNPILLVKGCPDFWLNNYNPQGWEMDMTNVHTGIKSIKLKNGFTSPGLVQLYTFKPNTTYEYSVWVKGENVVNTMIAIASLGTNVYYSGIPAGTYNWTKVTAQFTTPAVAGKGGVHVVVVPGSNGTYWFDDVNIIEQ